jgi:hypothetical protein
MRRHGAAQTLQRHGVLAPRRHYLVGTSTLSGAGLCVIAEVLLTLLSTNAPHGTADSALPDAVLTQREDQVCGCLQLGALPSPHRSV